MDEQLQRYFEILSDLILEFVFPSLSLQPTITHKVVEDLILELPSSKLLLPFFNQDLIHKVVGHLMSELPSPNLFQVKDNQQFNGEFEFGAIFS